MLIFGWGRVTNKQYGATLVLNCPHCHYETWWHLIRRRVWFTFFFIPVIPYRSKHLLLCQACSKGEELAGDRIERAKQLNELTQGLLNEKISELEYCLAADKIAALG